MNQQIGDERNEGRIASTAHECLGEEIEHGDGDEKSRRQRQNQVEGAETPSFAADHRNGSEHVRACCRRGVQQLGARHACCNPSRSTAAATALANSGAGGKSSRFIFQLFVRTRFCSSSPLPSSRYSQRSVRA